MKFEAVGVVHEPVENGFGEGRIADDGVPGVADRSDQRRGVDWADAGNGREVTHRLVSPGDLAILGSAGGRPGSAFALGGSAFAERLMLRVGNDTLLRVVRGRAAPRSAALTVVGIDDRAFRRHHRYGTIVCDLERRCVVALLPDREITTTTAWLAEHPGIAVISRDRGGGYRKATTPTSPNAAQVADRWHLMENASDAFLNGVQRSMSEIRNAFAATMVSPALVASSETPASLEADAVTPDAAPKPSWGRPIGQGVDGPDPTA